MRRRGEGGYTLTELMVAMIVLFIGALAVLKMLAVAGVASRFDETLSEAVRLAENRVVWLRGIDLRRKYPALNSSEVVLADEETAVDAVRYRLVATGGPAEGRLVPLAVKVTWQDPATERERDYGIEYVWRGN